MLDFDSIPKARVAVLAVAVVALALFSGVAAARGGVAIMSEEELLESLGDPDLLDRRAGISVLGRLGPSHFELVSSLLAHEHYDVRYAAYAALGRIGDDRVAEVLRGALDDTARLRRDVYYITGALLESRDIETLGVLEALAESHPSKYVRSRCRKTAAHMESRTWDEPALTVNCGRVECNFLLDDIECICVRNSMWGFVRIIFPMYYEDICMELRSTEQPPHDSMISVHGYFHIELRDGRRAEVEINGGGEFTVESYPGRRHSFVSAGLDEIIGDAAVPAALPGRVSRCSDLIERESSN